MFSLFKPRPPLTTGQRVNLELLMRRTIDAIGSDLPRQCRIVPHIRQLEIETIVSASSAELAYATVQGQFPKIEPSVEMQVSTQEDFELPSVYHPARDSASARIELHADTLHDPLRAVVELANQYATHFWHASGLIEPDQVHPNLSELLPICCGLGVLASEAAFYDSQSSTGGWQRWSMSKSGFYNAAEIGYASALLVRHRCEPDPSWLNSMRLDSRETAKKALRYFANCDRNERPLLFDGDRIPSSSCDLAELTNWFEGCDSAFAMAAGYAMLKQEVQSSRVAQAAARAVDGRNRELLPIAIRLLGRSPTTTDGVSNRIAKFVANKNHVISIAALQSADELGLPLAPFRKRIEELLGVYADGSLALVDMIAKQGRAFESFDRLMCEHLTEAVLYSNDQAIKKLVGCLDKISEDPAAAIERFISDVETKERLLSLIGVLGS